MMKHLLLAALLGFGGAAYGQTVGAAKPQIHDNLILVQTSDSAAVALRKLAAVFVAQGFTVERLDTQFLTLALAPKMIANRYNPTLTARAIAAPGAASTLKLSGEYKGFIGDVPLANFAQYYGSEGASNKTTFRALERVALAYPGGKVTYGKQ